jgi:pimeloyl-ACP methyl ester carboxylesterase
VGNNPVNSVDPSGHKNEDWQKSPSSGHQGCSSQKNYNCARIILILVCGAGTEGADSYPGEKCDNEESWDDPEDGYEETRPLSDYEEWATARGVETEYFGFRPGDDAAAVQARIEAYMDENPGAEFILVGHSGGADAALLAANNQAKLGKASRIVGVILLDAGAMKGTRKEITDMVNFVRSKGVDVRSFSSIEIDNRDKDPNDGYITLPEGTVRLDIQEHKALAVNNAVLNTTLPILTTWLIGWLGRHQVWPPTH